MGCHADFSFLPVESFLVNVNDGNFPFSDFS